MCMPRARHGSLVSLKCRVIGQFFFGFQGSELDWNEPEP